MNLQRLPDARAYLDALSDPVSRADVERRFGALECSPNGLPKVYAGAFSTTFHCETPGGGVALRCFTRSADDLERYVVIADSLRHVRTAALCRTQYVPYGIRIGDAWWPAIEMEWIAGRTLDAEIEARLADSDAMLELATRFRETVQSLGALGIAHGDLQHGNILVADGQVRLIDYDAMFVPALAGMCQLEYGDRNYQHPKYRTAPFDGRLDRFSSIVIYTALVALAADRSLWSRFNVGGTMFRVNDFTSNGSSELFRTLLANTATSGLARALLVACRMPVEEVPTLEEVIRTSARPLPTFSPEVAREAPPPSRPAIPLVPPRAAVVEPSRARTAAIPDRHAASAAAAGAQTDATGRTRSTCDASGTRCPFRVRGVGELRNHRWAASPRARSCRAAAAHDGSAREAYTSYA